MPERRKPGVVRDAIIDYFRKTKRAATVSEIREAVNEALGEYIPASSVRSYLGLNTPGTFERVGRGAYRMRGR